MDVMVVFQLYMCVQVYGSHCLALLTYCTDITILYMYLLIIKKNLYGKHKGGFITCCFHLTELTTSMYIYMLILVCYCLTKV